MRPLGGNIPEAKSFGCGQLLQFRQDPGPGLLTDGAELVTNAASANIGLDREFMN